MFLGEGKVAIGRQTRDAKSIFCTENFRESFPNLKTISIHQYANQISAFYDLRFIDCMYYEYAKTVTVEKSYVTMCSEFASYM